MVKAFSVDLEPRVLVFRKRVFFVQSFVLMFVLILELLAQIEEFFLDLRDGDLLFEFFLELYMGGLNLFIQGVVQNKLVLFLSKH